MPRALCTLYILLCGSPAALISCAFFCVVVINVKRLYDMGASECLLVSDAR